MELKLKMGMVGGGRGGFIGAIHRMGAWLDGKIELVSGAFLRMPKNRKHRGRIFASTLRECIAIIERWLLKRRSSQQAARAIEAEVSGKPIPKDCGFPTVEDGVDGMAFIATAVESAKNGSVWTKMKSV